MNTDTRIDIIDPLTSPDWEKLITRLPSLVFHSPAWLGAVAATYGFTARAVVLFEGSEAKAGLPFVEINDPKGPRVVCFPFCDYMDPIAEEPDQADLILARLTQEFPDHAIRLRYVNAPPPRADLRFEKYHAARWHGVDLAPGIGAIYKNFHPKFRTNLRKARELGVEVIELPNSKMREFFRLHLHVRKYRYRMLAQPAAFFQNIYREFSRTSDAKLLAARADDGAIVASIFVLFWKDQAIYKFGASDYQHKDLRANHLLHFRVLELAAERGASLYDLGLSDDDQSGLIRYKRELGGEEREIAFYERKPDKEGRLATAAEFGEALAEITRLATRDDVPDSVTEKFGDILYRYFT